MSWFCVFFVRFCRITSRRSGLPRPERPRAEIQAPEGGGQQALLFSFAQTPRCRFFAYFPLQSSHLLPPSWRAELAKLRISPAYADIIGRAERYPAQPPSCQTP